MNRLLHVLPRPAALLVALGLAVLLMSVGVAPVQAAPGRTTGPATAATAATANDPAGAGRSTPSSDGPRSVTRGRAKAERTLARAQRLLSAKPASAAAEQRRSGRDATMVLRRLWLQKAALSPTDRRAARALGRRPTDTDQVTCSLVCVHWNSAETTAAFAAGVASTMDYVQGTYTAAGYRTPKPDRGRGGNNLPDVYLDDIGAQGLYGYCTSDQGTLVAPGRYDVWAFCVLDNDFSAAEFPTNTPQQNMEVTAAHEYFHATQYAYDSAEDAWFLESLAVWAEDALFPEVNDNLQYLASSIITNPRTSLDKARGIGIYGSWIWIRYLSERYPRLQGPLPKIVLSLVRQMDSSSGSTNLFSTQAIASVLRGRGGFAANFAAFADANRHPRTSYAEGALYPTATLWKKAVLGAGERTTATARLNHQSSATVRLTPGAGLAENASRLKVTVDLAPRSQGSAAVVAVHRTDGTVKTTRVALDAAGDGVARTAFAPTKVAYVELTLANASTRYARCYARETPFACSGRPLDQRVDETFRAVARG